MLTHRCLHCLAALSCGIRFDKHGRPFTHCRICNTRAFLHSLEALRGLAVLPKLAEDAMTRRAQNPAYAEWFDAQLREIHAYVTERLAGPRPAVPANGTIPLQSSQGVVPFEMSTVARKAMGHE